MKYFDKCILAIACFFPLIETSCKKEENISNKPNDFRGIYESYWTQMSSHYMFWDLDQAHLEKVYLRYKPIFENLDYNNSSDVIKSVEYFKDITFNLTDGHYRLVFKDKRLNNFTYMPSYEKNRLRIENTGSYSYTEIDKSYLLPNFKAATIKINNETLSVLTGLIDAETVYFYCNRFNLFKAYNEAANNEVKKNLEMFFDCLKNRQIKNVILDLRGNPGGDLADLNFLFDHVLQKPLHFGYTQYKNDFGRLDYTPLLEAIITPKTKSHELKIIALTNCLSASLSEIIAAAIKSMPNGLTLGDTTWGATSPVSNTEIFNSGSFNVGDFISVEASSCRFISLDGKIYEGKGISPDINVLNSHEMFLLGKDVQLEAAITYFRKR